MDDEQYKKFMKAWTIAKVADTAVVLTHHEMRELLVAIRDLRAENAKLLDYLNKHIDILWNEDMKEAMVNTLSNIARQFVEEGQPDEGM